MVSFQVFCVNIIAWDITSNRLHPSIYTALFLLQCNDRNIHDIYVINTNQHVLVRKRNRQEQTYKNLVPHFKLRQFLNIEKTRTSAQFCSPLDQNWKQTVEKDIRLQHLVESHLLKIFRRSFSMIINKFVAVITIVCIWLDSGTSEDTESHPAFNKIPGLPDRCIWISTTYVVRKFAVRSCEEK